MTPPLRGIHHTEYVIVVNKLNNDNNKLYPLLYKLKALNHTKRTFTQNEMAF